MADVFTKTKRSEVMSHIRGRGNKNTELALVRLFKAERITGWRRHLDLVGRPDFTFRKQRVVIFVDGCFWHCCPKHSNTPEGNRKFWEKKLAATQVRDRFVTRTLRHLGWHVIRIWEHEFRRPTRFLTRIRSVLDAGEVDVRH